MAANVTVRPATAGRWGDVVAVFGTRGDPSWCWCQFFLTTGQGYTQDAQANKAALHREVAGAGTTCGLVAYVDDEPVGWVQLGPRSAFPRVTQNRAAVEVVGEEHDESVWRTTCFVVRVGKRRQGAAAALLQGAVDLARARGASVLEGHPVDVAGQGGKVASANLYHGVLSTFLAAGFEEVGRTERFRPVVRLRL